MRRLQIALNWLTAPIGSTADAESTERARVYSGFILIMITIGPSLGFWILPAAHRADGLSDTPLLIATTFATVSLIAAYAFARFARLQAAAITVVGATVACTYLAAFNEPRVLMLMNSALIISVAALPFSTTLVVAALVAASPVMLALHRPAVEIDDIWYIESTNVMLPTLLVLVAWYQIGIIRDRDRSARLMADLVQHSPIGILAMETSGSIEAANPAIEAIARRPAGEMVNRQLESVGLFDHDVVERFRQLRPGETVELRTVFGSGGGGSRTVDCTARSIEAEAGHTVIHINVRDVEDEVVSNAKQRELEGQLAEARRLESLGRLVGGLAHDLNNQLTVVLLGCELATTNSPDVDLSPVTRAADQARLLVEQLLTYARQQVSTVERVELDAVINDAIPIMRTLLREEVTLDLDLRAPGSTVRIDKTQIVQVLINLVANGADAMSHRGTLRVSTDTTELDTSGGEAVGLQPGHYAKLEVEDSGTGIDQADLLRVFDPFFTRKDVGSGTGLGLATVHGIVEQSGGAAWVESSLGEGAIFRVLVPCSFEPATTTTVPLAGDGIQRLDGKRALVVDDQPLVGQSICRALDSVGCHAVYFESVTEALDVLSRESGFDILVSDVVMPGMSGPQLAARVRLIYPDIAVLLISGYLAGQDTDSEEFLAKPFSVGALLEAVAGAFAKAATEVDADVSTT